MPTPDRYPHALSRPAMTDAPYRCEHCGMIDPDDGTESECPVPLRAEVDRLTAELAAATAFTVSGDWQPANYSIPSNGCETLPAGFRTRPGALCGGKGPAACRKPSTCRRRNECSYLAPGSAAIMADAFAAGGRT